MTSPQPTDHLAARRPLKSRGLRIFTTLAQKLADTGITPNQISMASIYFSVLAAICLLLWPILGDLMHYPAKGFNSNIFAIALPLLAALFIQLRLLCNLIDGLVAVESGKKTPNGELFNEIPDRIADAVTLIAAGYAATIVGLSPAVGWLAALLAVMTAYVRALAMAVGTPADFQGPMAKPHRMALMTAACVLSAFEGFFWQPGYVLATALVLLTIGTAWTVWRRIRTASNFLLQQ